MDQHTTLIIAEAGVNHNGSVETAKVMIEAAARSGADAVKFQTFSADSLLLRDAEKAAYQKNEAGAAETQYEMLKELELNRAAHLELMSCCGTNSIEFLSSSFDKESTRVLNELGVSRFKIPSGEITNLPYLRHVGSYGKPIILSTGMATMSEVGDALDVLEDSGTTKSQITVLHCSSAYPTPVEDVNLRAMLAMRDKFGVAVGYSDHTLGFLVSVAAVALGATVVEKHFTLDREMRGPDHRTSSDPEQLKALVDGIRQVEEAMGDGWKRPRSSEIENMPMARKSIVTKKAIRKGERFSEDNLAARRPGTGVSPMEWDRVTGAVAGRDYDRNELIEWD